jgi:hypothetical protein
VVRRRGRLIAWNVGGKVLPDGLLQLGGYPWVWNYDAVSEAAPQQAAERFGGEPDGGDRVLLAEWGDDLDGFDLGIVDWAIQLKGLPRATLGLGLRLGEDPLLSGKRVPAPPPAEVAGRPGGLTAAAQGCMVSYTCS